MCDWNCPRFLASDASFGKKVFLADEIFTCVKEGSRGWHTALTRTAYQMDAIFFQGTLARSHSLSRVTTRAEGYVSLKLLKESSWFKRIYAGWRVCCLQQTSQQ